MKQKREYAKALEKNLMAGRAGAEKKKAKLGVVGSVSGEFAPLAAGGSGSGAGGSAGGAGHSGFRDLDLNAPSGSGRKEKRIVDANESRDIFEELVDNDGMELDEM